MSNWFVPLECPKCGNKDTHFVEPRYEMSVYARNACGCQFEVEEDEQGLEKRKIAYFTMEAGLDPKMPTYSGGLGVLAGDTLKSCADLGVPLIAVTLLNEKGYFTQKLDTEGNQTELAVEWNKEDFLRLLPEKVSVFIEGREVKIQVQEYVLNAYL
jgi:starch phosphorylase